MGLVSLDACYSSPPSLFFALLFKNQNTDTTHVNNVTDRESAALLSPSPKEACRVVAAFRENQVTRDELQRNSSKKHRAANSPLLL